MAFSVRQYGRRAAANAATTTSTTRSTTGSGSVFPISSTGATSTSRRRYVLDTPTDRTGRISRTTRTNYQMNDEYDDTNTRSRSADFTSRAYSNVLATTVNNENSERLLRSGSQEYYYQSGATEPSATTITRYLDDSSVKQVFETDTTYMNTAAEDQEVQALTRQATPDVKNYPINVDPNPEVIVRPMTQRLTYTQDIAVRYLKPSTPPPPGPIIIREVRAPPPPPVEPITLRQRPPPPRTPSPVIIREKPPPRPKSVPTKVIRKIIPPPPPPPRKLIIERLPNLPPKPHPIIIERWLPYQKHKRQVIHERAKPLEPMTRIKNTIIEWRSPEVEIFKNVRKLGVKGADPNQYYNQHGDQLYTTEFVQRKLTELGLQEELALMHEQQTAVAKEEAAFEQANEYNIRHILNDYGKSSTTTRPSYMMNTDGAVMRLVRSSSHSGIVDDDDEQQILYNRSSNNSATPVYNPNYYSFDENSSSGTVLTEDMLLRSYTNSNGKFPSHLLTRLGSQMYDVPSDFSSNAKQTRAQYYYNVNAGENNLESLGYEIQNATPNYAQEEYVQIKKSDLNDVLSNYDVYSSTGQKLEGEQLNF